MWKAAFRFFALLLVGSVAVIVDAGEAAAQPDPARVCATADQLIEAGYLTEARTLFKHVPGEAPFPCMPVALQLIDERRAKARVETQEGQRKLDQGEKEKASDHFKKALDWEADNAAALAGLTAAAKEQPKPKGFSAKQDNWDAFYHDWLVPLLQLIAASAVGIIVLGALSGVAAHWVVRPQSVVWPRPARVTIGWLGVVLLVACGLLLPLYAMFTPFSPTTGVLDLAVLALLLPILAVVLAVAYAANSATGQSRQQVWVQWLELLCSLAAVACAGLLVSLTGLTERPERLLTAYIVLSCFAVLLTAATLGQNLRLQVEAQTQAGTTDSAATDYLLARMRTLGTEARQGRLNAVPAATSLSNIRTEDLSALPAGKVAGTLSRLFFALRPDLTWRARVVSVDANRIAVTLNRNGRHAESAIFSRLDLGLPTVEDDKAQDRLRAQLLTGAAAIILVRLSQAHPELRPSLCGAKEWRSVTLQVIASSVALIDSPDQRIPTLGRAVHEDQGNKLARLEYLWALQGPASFDSPLYRQIAETTDKLLEELTDDSLRALRIRGYYRSTSQWLNMYAQSGHNDRYLLKRARRSVDKLKAACTPIADQYAPVAQLASRARPLAATFSSTIEALRTREFPDAPPDPTNFLSPRLSYENACFDCALLQIEGDNPEPYVDHAVQHLRVGLPTSRDTELATKDPCLSLLRDEPRFRSLVGAPPAEFLKVQTFAGAAFAGVAGKLEAAGLSRPEEIVFRASRPKWRAELAEYLRVSPLLVDQILQVASLTRVHPDLADPMMLNMLLKVGIDSPARLRDEIRTREESLMRQLRELAKAEGTSALQGIERPDGWLAAGRR